MDDLLNRVILVISHHLGVPPEDIKSTTTSDELGLDSLDDIELIMCLEEQFEVDIDEKDFSRATTVSDMGNHLRAII